ncbi:MAG: hypothetical protein P8X98_16150, partial [Woeseiaceae bacterium]
LPAKAAGQNFHAIISADDPKRPLDQEEKTMSKANRAVKILLLICAFYTSSVSADYPPEFEPVVRIFSGLSFADHDMIRNATTQDFLLLEAGEVWDMDFLLSLVKPSDEERTNYFSVISMERFGGIALINYWNKALIVDNGKESNRAWLESVLAIETETGWKLKQMHSTRIEPTMIPDHVELEQMMLDRL